jgi:hypothetical protein
VRGDIYAGEDFADFRRLLAQAQPERPERLQAAYFARSEPEELLYEEIEAIWASIDAGDDWSAFNAKLAAIEVARNAYAYAV